MRIFLKNSPLKFCNDIDYVDNIAKDMVDHFNTYLLTLKTWRGGFEIQVNVVDKETLEKARLTPEEYRDLVVRIGGYSDYFVKLSDEMQREVILRTEHQI